MIRLLSPAVVRWQGHAEALQIVHSAGVFEEVGLFCCQTRLEGLGCPVSIAGSQPHRGNVEMRLTPCLLYTSDAADE